MATTLTPLSNPPRAWQRKRGNRFAGKIWVIVLFFVLAAMNGAASLVADFFGTYAGFYRGALFIALFWDAVLLCAIWLRNNWARFALAVFLLSFDGGMMIFIPDLLVRHPSLNGEAIEVLGLLGITNALAAAFVLSSIDIRWIGRPTDAGAE